MLTKGDRFSATSPLSQDDKKFLLTFQNSAEERVLSDENLDSDQHEIFKAREAGVDGSPRLGRAQRRLQRLWADQLNVELYTGTCMRWWNVAGGVPPKGTYDQSPPGGWPEKPPAWDHSSIWVRGKRPLVAVSQPYPWLLNRDIADLDEFADSYGLNFRISNYPSWHYPGRCWFVEWYRAQSSEEYKMSQKNDLSDDAKSLLISAEREGKISCVFIPLQPREVIAGGRNFVEDPSPRSQARWKSAVKELKRSGLIEGKWKHGFYFVTHKGFQVIDEFPRSSTDL